MERSLDRSRITSAVATIIVHAALIALLFTLGGGAIVQRASEGLVAFDVIEEPPPPPAQPAPPKRSVEPEGAAAPPALRATPKAIVAPLPDILIPIERPVEAAPVRGEGSETRSGASDRDGPGTGGGGEGTGTGSGRFGNGSGGIQLASRAAFKSGRIKPSDYPRGASRDHVEGLVLVHYTVLASGRVSGCTIERSSGNAELDAATCMLIEKRFRYEPARDRAGRAVEDVAGWEQRWWLD